MYPKPPREIGQTIDVERSGVSRARQVAKHSSEIMIMNHRRIPTQFDKGRLANQKAAEAADAAMVTHVPFPLKDAVRQMIELVAAMAVGHGTRRVTPHEAIARERQAGRAVPTGSGSMALEHFDHLQNGDESPLRRSLAESPLLGHIDDDVTLTQARSESAAPAQATDRRVRVLQVWLPADRAIDKRWKFVISARGPPRFRFDQRGKGIDEQPWPLQAHKHYCAPREHEPSTVRKSLGSFQAGAPLPRSQCDDFG